MNTRWSPFVKQIVIVSGLIATVWLILREEVLLEPLILTLLLAYLVSFPVNFLVRHTGWPRTLIVILIYLVLVVLIVTAPVLIVPRLISVAVSLGNALIGLITDLTAATPQPIRITPTLTIDLGPYYEPVHQWLTGLAVPDVSLLRNLFPFASGAAVVVRGAVGGLLVLLLILVISFILVKDWPMMARWLLTRLPESFRPELRRLGEQLARVWDSFVRGQLTIGLVMGMLVGIATSILGIRNAPALGLLSALGEFVPGIGSTIAATIGTLIALFGGSVWIELPPLGFAAVTAATYFLLIQFENLYVIPRIVGHRVSLHPVVIIAGALAGAELGGMLGLLLAAPTIASTRVIFGYVIHKLLDEDPFPQPGGLSAKEALWAELARSRNLRAVLFDLDGTLIETDDEMVGRLAQRFAWLRQLMPAYDPLRAARRWLMFSEVWINGIVTLLDRLHLDTWLFRLSDALRRGRGIRHPERFVAVAGAPEMLRSLHECYRLAVVTSRSRREADAFLAQYGLTDLFYAVITRDDVTRLKPHPMPIHIAAHKLGVTPAECAMVGDTSVDITAAKAAGALTVGVLCGFGTDDDLKDADLVIGTTAQLTQWV